MTFFVVFVFTPQSVLPFFVATKMSKIRRPTLTVPSPERYVSAELSTVGLQTQTNGYLPHAIMVCAEKRPLTWNSGCRKMTQCVLSEISELISEELKHFCTLR